jgi:hypothetical protein
LSKGWSFIVIICKFNAEIKMITAVWKRKTRLEQVDQAGSVFAYSTGKLIAEITDGQDQLWL